MLALVSHLNTDSASSTTYTSTPTSSLDSAPLSTATSATSVFAPFGSGRHSTGIGKRRRNSAGIDASSVYSGGDCALYKDRTTGSLAASAEALEGDHVPPIPLPLKDLSIYRPPTVFARHYFSPLEWMIVILTAWSSQSRSLQPLPCSSSLRVRESRKSFRS